MEKVVYLGGARVFVVCMDGNHVYLLKLDDLPEADSSPVLRWRLGQDRHYFRIYQASGNRLDVPWDDVLYHCEPEYEFYKGRQPGEPQGDRARRIGARVRELRSARGLSVSELAERAGMQRPNLSRLEHGKHLPSLETLERIAEALDVPVAQLIAEKPSSGGAARRVG